jgi:hypothetical protein
MTDMIERVAKALRQSDYTDCEPENVMIPIWCYFDQARAAIAAMREPTEKMELEGYSDGACECGSTKATWQAMIDAALSEASDTPVNTLPEK